MVRVNIHLCPLTQVCTIIQVLMNLISVSVSILQLSGGWPSLQGHVEVICLHKLFLRYLLSHIYMVFSDLENSYCFYALPQWRDIYQAGGPQLQRYHILWTMKPFSLGSWCLIGTIISIFMCPNLWDSGPLNSPGIISAYKTRCSCPWVFHKGQIPAFLEVPKATGAQVP